MSYNRKLLKQMTEESKKKKFLPAPKDRIVDPMGQWTHPGEITRIPSNRITMQGVPYPVLAKGSSGAEGVMYPDLEYFFPDSTYVDEYPLVKAQNGINLNLPKYNKSEDKQFNVNPYTFGFNPAPGVNIFGIGARPSLNLLNNKKDKLALTGDISSVSVGYPGGQELFTKPQYGFGVRYTRSFENGGQPEPTPLELAKIKAKMALESHFGNPAARRMTTPYPQSLVFKEQDGKIGRGTHYVYNEDNYVVPMIQEGPNGKLFYNQNASPNDREAMRFNSPEDAASFAQYYKHVAPMTRSFRKNGGDISIPNLEEGSWLDRFDDGGEFSTTVETTKRPKAASEKNPYKEINSGAADLFRNILPVPDNVSQLLAKQFFGDARMSNESLEDKQKVILWNVIQNAIKRSGQKNGGTEYEDYGNIGYGTAEDFQNWFNRGKLGIWDLVKNSLGNPGFKLASTIGRGRYWSDPNDPETIYYTDVYDWNSNEKNFKGTNQYQNLRNYVRSTEDKNLNADKNDMFRMNFKLNKKEIDRILNADKSYGEIGVDRFGDGGLTKQQKLEDFYKRLYSNVSKRDDGFKTVNFKDRALGTIETVLENPLQALQLLFTKKHRIKNYEANPYNVNLFSQVNGNRTKTWYPNRYIAEPTSSFDPGTVDVRVGQPKFIQNNNQNNNIVRQPNPHWFNWFDPSLSGGLQGGWHRKRFDSYDAAQDYFRNEHKGKIYGSNVSFIPIRDDEDLTEYDQGGQLQQFDPGGFITTLTTTLSPYQQMLANQQKKVSGNISRGDNTSIVRSPITDIKTGKKEVAPRSDVTFSQQWSKPIVQEFGIEKKIEKEIERKQIQERKNAAVTRAKVIAGDNNATFTFPDGKTKAWKDMDWREQAYVSGKNLGSFNNNNWTDYVNPLAMIGSMGEGLATSPYVARETNSIMPYVTGIGAPLLTGRMLSSGSLNPISKNFWTRSNSNVEFLNNALNPFAPVAGLVEKYAPNQVQSGVLRSTIVPMGSTSRSVARDKAAKKGFQGWIDDQYAGSNIISHETAQGNKYNINFNENTTGRGSWERTFDITNADNQGQHFKFKISKKNRSIPIIEDLAFFNNDPVTANEQLKLFLSGIDNSAIQIPLSVRNGSLVSGAQNLSMYSQPIMNVQAARLARQVGNNGQRRLELIYDNARRLKDLNYSMHQGVGAKSFRDQLLEQWPKIENSFKLLSKETGVRMKRPRLYYQDMNSFELPEEVFDINFFNQPRFRGTGLKPVDVTMQVPEYGIIKHFKKGGDIKKNWLDKYK